MIDVHVSVAAIFALFGIVAISGFAAYCVGGFFVMLHFDGPDRWFWIGIVAAVATFLGLGALLSWWAGLW